METAFRLFYRQGYQATGINQLIAESGVAKATFYAHFTTKDDLLNAYLLEAARRELADIRAAIPDRDTPHNRFYGMFRLLVPWFESTGYRGCPFQNILAEAPAATPKVAEISRQYRENLRALFRELAFDLLQNRPAQAPTLSVEWVADTALVLFEGAISLATAYRQGWPVTHAMAAMEKILEIPQE